MKWSEVITVRLVGDSTEMITSTLRELIIDVARDLGREAIRVFRREKLDTDVCIVLFHNVKKKKSGGSALGLRLVNALKEFGIVHHVVWIELDREPDSTI